MTELLKNWTLTPNVYKQTVHALLDVHLQLGPPADVVRYFEIVKEKWPDEEIPFDKIVKVGAAYHEMGEYERSYLVFRATVESNFQRESAVAGFLESQGQFVRSVDVLSRLLREYPPEGYVAEAAYSLAQHVCAKAAEVAATPPQPPAASRSRQAGGGMFNVDPIESPEKLNRVELLRRAWAMFESFLTAHPDDPAADQAALADAGVLLDLKAYKDAAAACDSYAKRYPKSDLLDAYWYVIGYCHFAAGEDQAAIEMCRKVADTKRIDPATRPRGGLPQQVAGDLHPRPGLSQPGQGGRRDPRVPPRRGPFRRRPAGDRVLPPQVDRAARGLDVQAGRAGGSGIEVPQRRRLRREGLPHRPDEVRPVEAKPRRNRRDQPGRHSPAARRPPSRWAMAATTATAPANCRCRWIARGRI